MLRKLFFNLAYYQKPIWDTGVSPQELIDFINAHPPGKALELGCGTGTNAITLAKRGWQVTGIDFARRAIQIAQKKAHQNGVRISFRLEDVTRLYSIKGPFDLILDIGCFHSLPPNRWPIYSLSVSRLLAPEGTFLLYAFFKSTDESLGPGITEAAILDLSRNLRLMDRQNGKERGFRPSAWFAFKRIN